MSSEESTQAGWVSAWYAAPARPLTANLTGRTLRQIVHLHAGGEQIRLHLSNRYGDAAVTLSSISIGQVLSGLMVRPGASTILFDGRATVTLEPGQDVVSDPVPLHVETMSDLAITFVVAQGEALTGHLAALQTSYVSGVGDITRMPAEIAFIAYPLQTSCWWLITGIDVLPTMPINAVVAFGSSTTDGFGSTPNMNRRWTDYLARRLQDAGGTRVMSVVNAGISGNTLTALEETPQAAAAAAMGIPPALFGEAGERRLTWDVMAQSGATDLILHIGSNDLRFGVSSDTLIAAFQRVVKQARQRYKRVFGTTILPGGYTPEQAEHRRLVNAWMQQQEAQLFDAVFDFATPLRDSNNEAVLNQAYDSGDGMHPNDEGYRLIAEAVDINALTGSSTS